MCARAYYSTFLPHVWYCNTRNAQVRAARRTLARKVKVPASPTPTPVFHNSDKCPTVRPQRTVVRTTEIGGVGVRVDWVSNMFNLRMIFFCTSLIVPSMNKDMCPW